MSSLMDRFAEYKNWRKQQGSLLLHYVGVATLLIGALILLDWFSISVFRELHISFAWLLTILLIVYYFMIHLKMAIASGIVLVILAIIVTAIAPNSPSPLSVIIALAFLGAGFALLFILNGKKGFDKSSLFSNVMKIAISPLFITLELLQRFGLEKYVLTEPAAVKKPKKAQPDTKPTKPTNNDE